MTAACRSRVTAAQYRAHTLLGLALGGIAWAVSWPLALWMSPVVLGLALAIPLAAVTARRDVGLAMRRLGLLRIPEEMRPPDVLANVRQAMLAEGAIREGSGVMRLLHDPALLAAHRSMLPPALPERPDAIDIPLAAGRARLEVAESPVQAFAAMTPAERLACLGDHRCLERLLRLDHAQHDDLANAARSRRV